MHHLLPALSSGCTQVKLILKLLLYCRILQRCFSILLASYNY
jgi:hypothetical protein